MPAPLQLVAFDRSTQQFTVQSTALNLLASLDGPIGVLCVSGRARQGKSYILNQLLGHNGAFKVASTQQPCTEGLWIWSEPIMHDTPGLETFRTIVIDTEGVDAFNQTLDYSTKIFCLAVLLSSFFVFNQMGPIDEAALNQLSLVCELTKQIRRHAEDQGFGVGQLQDFAPSFLWLLRDFYLDLNDEGKAKMTPKDYLEMTLMEVGGTGEDIAAKNQIRRSIKQLFPDRDCCMLVRPIEDEAQLRQLDNLPASALRPEFIKGMREVLAKLNAKVRPKRFGSTLITGPMLAKLTESYVSAINDGAVPNIASAWTGVMEAQARRALEAAENTYNTEFDVGLTTDINALYTEHLRCVFAALKVFDRISIGDEAVKQPHRERLMSHLHQRFEHVQTERCREAAIEQGQTAARIAELESELERTHAQLQQALDKIAQLENARAETPPVWNGPGRDAAIEEEPSIMKSSQSATQGRTVTTDLDNMTVAELKSWLMNHDFADVVWSTLQQKRPKKADWIQLVKERL